MSPWTFRYGVTCNCAATTRSNSASNVIYFTKNHDPAEMAIIKAVVQLGDLVIDAGANIGVYTLLLAHLTGPTGRVIAIEPTPKAAERLRENVDRNELDQVQVVEAAVGSAPGEAALTVGFDVSNTLTLRPGTSELATVPVTTLDALAPRAPSFVKIDVEGYEHEVLNGATDVLAARPVLQVEIAEHLLTRMGSSGAAIRKRIHETGYRTGFPVIEGGRVRLSDTTSSGNGNLIAIPSDRWEDVLRCLL